jgi:hypothetical protein
LTALAAAYIVLIFVANMLPVELRHARLVLCLLCFSNFDFSSLMDYCNVLNNVLKHVIITSYNVLMFQTICLKHIISTFREEQRALHLSSLPQFVSVCTRGTAVVAFAMLLCHICLYFTVGFRDSFK